MHPDDGYFDEPVAARYDESEAEMFEPEVVEPVVEVVVELAGEGRALELGIGTGRIALPLWERPRRLRSLRLLREALRRAPLGSGIHFQE